MSQSDGTSLQRSAPWNSLTSAPQNVSETERWVSLAAGGTMAWLGLRHGRLSGLLTLGVGASLIYRGLTGHCQMYQSLGINTAEEDEHSPVGVPAQQGVKVEQTMLVHRPAADLYAFWRKLESLPEVFHHLKEVRNEGAGRSHWIARGPLGTEIEWDAETINERDNELIAWRSIPGGDIDTAGSVHFNPVGQSTEVVVTMKYNPPGGQVGAGLASWFGSGLEQLLADDLRRFQQHMEAHEPNRAGQG